MARRQGRAARRSAACGAHPRERRRRSRPTSCVTVAPASSRVLDVSRAARVAYHRVEENAPASASRGDSLAAASGEMPARGALVVDATTGTILGHAFLNLLLNIVTLGFWRFWGRTRVRRYLWAHVAV